MSTALYDPVKTMTNFTDSVLVGISGGKDSAALIDLCFRYFDNVQPYFMYLVRDLEMQERTLRWYEDKYGVEIMRVPHFMLAEFYRYGTFRMPDYDVPMVKTVEHYNYLREKSGIYWIANGERIADSMIRRAMIKRSSSIDIDRGRFYPLAYWNKSNVMTYIKRRNIPLSLESRVLGFSFRSLMPDEMAQIKRHFPEDYEKIKADFPLLDASVKKKEFFNEPFI